MSYLGEVGITAISVTASNNITQIGGVGLSLGQKAMASSIPVVLASDQTGSGQKVMASSIPIAVASDQSAIPENLTQIGGVTAATNIGIPSAAVLRVLLAVAPPLIQTGKSAANTALTITLGAAGVGLFHYITNIFIARTCTAAIAGSALLDYTTTNLNGLAWSVGNALAIGATQIDLAMNYNPPIKSAVANTASTIVIPAIGATGISRVTVYYYVGAG